MKTIEAQIEHIVKLFHKKSWFISCSRKKLPGQDIICLYVSYPNPEANSLLSKFPIVIEVLNNDNQVED